MDQNQYIRLSDTPSLVSSPLVVLAKEPVRLAVESAQTVTSVRVRLNRKVLTVSKTSAHVTNFSFEAKTLGSRKLVIDAFVGKKKVESIKREVWVVQQSKAEVLEGGYLDGVTLHSIEGGREMATFVLTAPKKKFVHLIGECTSWDIKKSPQMKVDRSLGYERFWIRIPKPAKKKEYAYQFVADGDVRIADPYAPKVLSPSDKEIPPSVYPRLKKYPSDYTEEIVSVLDLRSDTFEWSDEDFEVPNARDLIVYEILLRDFTREASFKSAIAKLPYLKSIGVNAIELMPIFEFEDNGTWGYNTIFYFAPDRSYGPESELKKLVDSAHALGIAVLLDIALNHNFGQSSLVRLYNEGRYGPPTSDNPWFNTFPTHDFNVGYDFNHESSFTQDLVKRVLNYWINEFHIDGYRFDLSKGLTQKQTIGDMAAWAGYDAQRIAWLKSMADGLWENNPKAILILEHFSNNDEEQELAHYRVEEGFAGLLFWNNLNTKMGEAMMGYNDGDRSDLASAYHHDRGWSEANLISYIESHDHDRLVHKAKSFGAQIGEPIDSSKSTHKRLGYDCRDWATALNRAKMAATFFLLNPGPKMIWQFGELGCDQGSPLAGRFEGWIDLDQLLNVRERLLVKEVYAALIQLRKSESLFTSSDTVTRHDTRDALKYVYMKGPMMSAIVIGNFGVSRYEREIPIEQNLGDVEASHDWYDYFTGNSVRINGQSFSISLEPGAFHVLTDRPVLTPSQELLLWQTENGPNIYEGSSPITLEIRVNYYTESLIIRYAQDPQDHFSASIYDRSGLRLIATLKTRTPTKAFNGLVSWKLPRRLKGGVYLVKCLFGNRRLSRRVYINR